MKNKNCFLAETLEGLKVNFYIEDISNIHLNYVTLSATYKAWLDTGKFKTTEIELAPESLNELVSILEQWVEENKLSLVSSKSFLKLYPSTEELKKHIDYINSLPVDDIKTIKSK
ncbi:MAG: hypothetical protein K8Q99_04290 [Acholeplasmataceae bacterium]|nr:hypothetical protein [Acholeplasmataceae bacterium]